MRSGVLCILLVLLIRREGNGAAVEDEFKPTPIPLNEWREVREWRTPHEALHAPPAPAHYWEDALRHSVYLTLVRDKIDQLIATGEDARPVSDLGDRDLWEKIKRAPFESAGDEVPATFGDVALMAKGRLMDDNGGFRFAQDDKFKDKCTLDKCVEGVKALWSVKRVRQRDSEVSGRFHYELTFSVITQKKHKKPYEKPARTFTVRESAPEKIEETPQEYRYYELNTTPAPTRNDRALWYHKNLAPPRNQARQNHNGLERLFSSLFSDDDEDDLPPPRYKPKQYNPPPPVYQQYSKAGYVGSPSEQQHKKIIPHNHNSYKHLHMYKYKHSNRPLPPPPQPIHHHYLDIEQIGVVSNPYQDHRYGPPTKPGKTQRPPVLPTPPNPILPHKNFTFETTTQMKPNETEETTQKLDVVHPPKTYNKQKPTTVKISYVTDHVRPPVYNAPPGVFVTMDKKPFKPMPPLRLVHSSKFHKTPRPTDFRPSPQVLDIQFSEPDPLGDTAFRPITVNYANSNSTDKSVVAASDNHFRKSNNTTAKKPPKKNEIVKARVTTTAPEIITAHSVEADSDTEWTNVLGAFAKTTPMAAEKEKTKTTEVTTPLTTVKTSTAATTTTTAPASTTMTPTPTSTIPAPTATNRRRTTTTTEAPTTTPKPKKRTRPPPKFKTDKYKKHKRITTTSTTETSHTSKKEQDLTPQASSVAATGKIISSTTEATTTTSTTTSTTTTTQPTTTTVQTTTTTEAPTTTTEHIPTPVLETETTKRKNRYRQSTLKYRSTSVNDKKEEKARTILPPTGIIPPRRKGTKYQNYISSTPKFSDMQFDEEGREDHVVSPYKSKSISTPITPVPSTRTTPTYEEVADHVYITSASPDYSMSHDDNFRDDDNDDDDDDDDDNDDLDEKEEDKQESRDNSEYLPSTSALVTPNETTNEIVSIETEPIEIAAEYAETTIASVPKNKNKCKKKKLHNLANTTEEAKTETLEPEIAASETLTSEVTATTTKQPETTPDILEQIFGGFTFDDSAEKSKNKSTPEPILEGEETTNDEQYIQTDDDFADLLQAFDNRHRQEHRDGQFDNEYEYDDEDDDDDDDIESPFQTDADQRTPRDIEETYDDYEHKRPFSLLELMAME